MNSKFYKVLTPSILILSAIAFLFLGFNTKSNVIISIISIGMTVGISFGTFTVLINGYFIPSKLIFKYRFWVYGLFFGLAIFLSSILNSLAEGRIIHMKYLLIKFIISIIIGIIFFGTFLYWNFRELKKFTRLETQLGELEILSDSATLDNEEATKSGRIILTTQRLCFISNDEEKTKFVFSFSDLTSGIEIIERLSIPDGIYIPNEETKIRVKFSKLWKKEILKIIKNNAD